MNFNDENLINKGTVLSAPVFTQLEAFVYEEFVSSFTLLNKLPIHIVR